MTPFSVPEKFEELISGPGEKLTSGPLNLGLVRRGYAGPLVNNSWPGLLLTLEMLRSAEPSVFDDTIGLPINS